MRLLLVSQILSRTSNPDSGVMAKGLGCSVPPGFDGRSGSSGDLIAIWPPAAAIPTDIALTRFTAPVATASAIVPSARFPPSVQPKVYTLPRNDLPAKAVRSVTTQLTWSGRATAVPVPAREVPVLLISGLFAARRSMTPTPVNTSVVAKAESVAGATLVLNEAKIVSAMFGFNGPASEYSACVT